MTELNLEKAKSNRSLREGILREYNKVNEAINNFNDEGFGYLARVRMHERADLQDIHPDPEEFRNLLLNMRDRYDAEINRLDNEFEKL